MENRFILRSDIGQATHPLTASNLSLMSKLIAAEDQRVWGENGPRITTFTCSQPKVYTLESSEPSPVRDPADMKVYPGVMTVQRRRKWLPLGRSQPTLLSGPPSTGPVFEGERKQSSTARNGRQRWLYHWKRRLPSPSEVVSSGFYSVTESQESGVARGRGRYRRSISVAKSGSDNMNGGRYLQFEGKKKMWKKILGWVGRGFIGVRRREK
ncbi:hypothetical protein N431DRAFT_354557 [Stipitochalara longipes BDJ]|nr:hypothetical protein N431DRAFT_354557 [Stipitochalara longipes BDJ]